MVHEERNLKAEEMHRQRDEELKQAITDLGAQLDRRLRGVETQLTQKLDPIYEIFESVSGFNKIGIWLLKLLAMIGGGLLGLYAVIEFIRKISK